MRILDPGAPGDDERRPQFNSTLRDTEGHGETRHSRSVRPRTHEEGGTWRSWVTSRTASYPVPLSVPSPSSFLVPVLREGRGGDIQSRGVLYQRYTPLSPRKLTLRLTDFGVSSMTVGVDHRSLYTRNRTRGTIFGTKQNRRHFGKGS